MSLLRRIAAILQMRPRQACFIHSIMTLKCILLKDSPETTRQLTAFIEKSQPLTLEAVTGSLKETLLHTDAGGADIIFLNIKWAAQVKHEWTEREKPLAIIWLAPPRAKHPPPQPGYNPLVTGDSLNYLHFLEAVQKAMLQLLAGRKTTKLRDEHFFFIKSEYRIIKVNFDDIIFCEGLKDYTQVYTVRKTKPIITLQNLKTFAERLPANRFVRIHRSYIVSLQHVESITKKEVEIGDRIVPIGNSFRSHLMEIVKRNS